MRRVLYMAHPVGGDVAGNLTRALAWLRFLRRSLPDCAVIAPWIAGIQSGEDDGDPAQRERGLLDCEATVARCDGIVLVGGRISSGMQRELDAARRAGAIVLNLTEMGLVAPDEPRAMLVGAGPSRIERLLTAAAAYRTATTAEERSAAIGGLTKAALRGER